MSWIYLKLQYSASITTLDLRAQNAVGHKSGCEVPRVLAAPRPCSCIRTIATFHIVLTDS